MSDIVERLRARAREFYCQASRDWDEQEEIIPILRLFGNEASEAADCITALEAELSAEKAKVAKLRQPMVEIRDRQARNILPWTHEQAADEYARMLDADRMTARRIHEETA